MKTGLVTMDWWSDCAHSDSAPWILRTDSPGISGHRDACIGNGLIGMRVDAMGDVSDYFPGPGSFMAGLWGAATENPHRPEGLLELPHWAGLRVSGADRELRRADRKLAKHWQELDMKTATVRTGYTEHNSEGTIEVMRESWLARGDPHIGVISAEIKVLSGGRRIYLDEVLDCMHIPEIADNRTHQEGEDLFLELVPPDLATACIFGHEFWSKDYPRIKSTLLWLRVHTLPADGFA
ncbi:MAG: hypothetical protein LR015_13975 [Verrucomicrobia bacterium]|nr:hypothetical protein [Verrucomicrobiota bacterium]